MNYRRYLIGLIQHALFPHRCSAEFEEHMNKCISAADVWAGSRGPTKKINVLITSADSAATPIVWMMFTKRPVRMRLIMPVTLHGMKLKLYCGNRRKNTSPVTQRPRLHGGGSATPYRLCHSFCSQKCCQPGGTNSPDILMYYICRM